MATTAGSTRSTFVSSTTTNATAWITPRQVAATLNLDAGDVFARHANLREMALVARVEPTMIHYRKNIVGGKWIKHRNHTYYDLTPKGKAYLAFHRLGK